MKKRLISLLLAFSMMLTFLPAGAVSAFAEENLGPYACGQNVTATLSRNNDGEETYTLTISGTGPMKNYDYWSARYMPWYSAIPKITRLIVCDGVTSLGDCVLRGFDGKHEASSLKEVTLPEGLTYLGDYACYNADQLKSITLPSTLTTIGLCAFAGTGLTGITIPSEVKTIRSAAFSRCTGLTSVTIPDKVETLGREVFGHCTQLTSIHIPKSVKSMGANMFGYCDALTCITFEPGSNLTETAPNGSLKLFSNTSSELKVYCEPVLKATLSGKDVPDEHIITTVDVTLVDGDKSVPKTINYGADITALDKDKPIKQGYTFTGWYTDADCKTRYPETQLFTNINGTKLYAGWKFDPNALSCRTLTVTGGTVTVKYDGSDVTSTLNIVPDVTGDKKTYSVPNGAKVTVTLDKTQIPEGMVFDIWTTGGFSLPSGQNYKAETITFTMSEGVNIAAQYRDATIEDDGSTVLGTAAMIGTAVVGTMVLGYQAYSLGTEFAGYLMDLPYFPANRSALAVMLWEDAGKPMPESERLYPDVGQEEQDMDLQHAARWAMENDLIPDRNEEGTAPEEMKFYPDNAVSRIDVLKAWQKAQELKKNA